jgi:hypothetical protein
VELPRTGFNAVIDPEVRIGGGRYRVGVGVDDPTEAVDGLLAELDLRRRVQLAVAL